VLGFEEVNTGLYPETVLPVLSLAIVDTLSKSAMFRVKMSGFYFLLPEMTASTAVSSYIYVNLDCVKCWVLFF